MASETQENRTNKEAMYKLWVKYKPEFVLVGHPTVRVYYSYDKPEDPEYGKRRLLSLIKQKMNTVQVAILYDNRTHIRINIFQA